MPYFRPLTFIEIELSLDKAENDREQSAEKQEERAGVEHRPDKTLNSEIVGVFQDILDQNEVCERSILNERDYLIAHGRHDALDDLQKHDLEKDLAFLHAEHIARLVLSLGDALDTAAVDFGKIGGVVDYKRYDRRRHAVLYPERALCNHGRDIVHHKKLQQKRNHINRFLENCSDWYTRPITAENLAECQAMAADWYQVHEDPEHDYQLEKVAICRAFKSFDALGMEGLALYADGKMVALTMGNRLRADTFDVNFEKAYADIPGAYPLINREFARLIHSRYPEVAFLNREEDMGLPGLRKSKLSYHPDVLLEKFRGFQNPEVTL